MKTQILIALGAVAIFAGAANAQTVPSNGDGVHLRNVPDIGPLFRVPIRPVPSGESSLFGPDMPPRPKLNSSPTSMKLSILKSPMGDVFQLEAVGQSRAAILKKITDIMGVRAVIDPALGKSFVITQVFRGLSWDELLAAMNFGVEMVKSPAGTYFFADKPFGMIYTFPLNDDSENERFLEKMEKLRKDPRYDPFVAPYGGLNPNLKGWNAEPIPLPNWQKREFNGHDFYYIPGLPESGLAK